MDGEGGGRQRSVRWRTVSMYLAKSSSAFSLSSFCTGGFTATGSLFTHELIHDCTA